MFSMAYIYITNRLKYHVFVKTSKFFPRKSKEKHAVKVKCRSLRKWMLIHKNIKSASSQLINFQ